MKMEILTEQGDEMLELHREPLACGNLWEEMKVLGNVVLEEFGFESPLTVCFGELLRIS